MQNSFATTLRMLREEKKLTQADLAGGHLSRTIISLYESGRKTPSYEAIQHIAERLGVAVDVFFGGGNEAAHKAFITLMQQAEKAEKRGDWADAVEMLDSAAALCGTYHLNKWKFYVDYHRGLALTQVGQWESAVEILLRECKMNCVNSPNPGVGVYKGSEPTWNFYPRNKSVNSFEMAS